MSTVRIQLRRGLEADWTSADTALNSTGGLVLAGGEVGLETDTGKFKFGDGETRWSVLPYALENTLGDYVLVADVGQPNGVASLNSSGKVPATQLDISELSQDAVNTALVAGTNITKSYNDSANTITIDLPAAVSLTTSLEAPTVYADTLNVYETATVEDLVISGNLTFNGTATQINSVDLVVTDPLIYIGEDNQANTLDLGIVGSFNNGTYQHTGLVKDATDGTWRLFSGVVTEPTTTIDFTTYTKDSLQIGALDATSATIGALDATSATIGDVSNTELQYLNGVTSAIQTQIDAKSPSTNPTFTGTVSLPSNTSIGDVSSGELGYLNGVTSAIQTQLNTKAPINSPEFTGTVSGITKDMVGLSNVDNTTDAGKPISTSTQNALDLKADIMGPTFSGTVILPATTSIGDISSTEIGYLNGITSGVQGQIDTKATLISPTFTGTVVLPSTTSIGDVSSTEIGYVNGVTSAIQTQLDAKAPSDSPTFTGTVTLPANTISQSMMGDDSVGTNEIGGLAVTTEKIANGAVTTEKIASGAVTKTMVGLANVDNTSDADKPVSTATQTALDLKANLNAPTFTGTVTSTNNLVVDGDFTVNGTNFAASATSITIEDNLVQLAHQNAANTVDLGLVVGYNDGATKHSGIVRDVSADKWKLFKGVTTEPSTTVDFTEGSLDALQVGAFEATTVTPSSGVVFSDGTQTKQGVPSQTEIIQKTESYTLSSLAERDDLIEMGSSSAMTLTIPTNSAVAYPIGTSIDILQTSTGQVTIAGSAGVTVNSTPGLKLRTQWSSATLFKRAENTWVVYGDLTA